MISSAKVGAWLTSSRKSFFEIGITAASVFAVAVALCVGGWLAIEGHIEVGTVVAIVGGLGKLNDPWGDLVNWAREFSVVGVKYRLFADAANRLAVGPPAMALAMPH